MSDLTVANTILHQLGGRRFIAMTGARALVGGAHDLTFRLPQRFAAKGIVLVRIALTPRDTYTVAFFSRSGRVISEHEDVYCDALVELFERETGLATRLPKVSFGRSPFGA
jgi:hypothetical protein